MSEPSQRAFDLIASCLRAHFGDDGLCAECVDTVLDQLADAERALEMSQDESKGLLVRLAGVMAQLTAATQREGGLREALLQIGRLANVGPLNRHAVGKIVDEALLTSPPGREGAEG